MSIVHNIRDWKEDFGLSDWSPPRLFTDAAQLHDHESGFAQAHVMRRAFDGLGLSGIVCLNNFPLIYFKEVEQFDERQIRALQCRLWNHGVSPILVLLDDTEARVYSGLAPPAEHNESVNSAGRLVTQLDRVAQAAELHQFVLAVESGELFRAHAKSFDPKRRVDRELLRKLRAAREALGRVDGQAIDSRVLDALLCRIVFTCYLFDRDIIDEAYLRSAGIPNCAGLLDVVAQSNAEAIPSLYSLFKKLGEDFNGDLFGDDLEKESGAIQRRHIEILSLLLAGADVDTGQGSFWPYDFSVIPIETISAIYEHFLKTADADLKKKTGAFYTPRFLAETVLDLALEGTPSLLEKRFLDPACGSGIFLVGLFNRLAEEWSRKNPSATYNQRAQGLMSILRNNLSGVDENPTACRIAAFSLYLAFLDQLRPSHIRELQMRGKVLPKLIFAPDVESHQTGRTIHCSNFFNIQSDGNTKPFDLVIGNPPWTSIKGERSKAEEWCDERSLPLANRQLALAFVWKAPQHLREGGKVCFLLPSGVLFNQQRTAIDFQLAWLKAFTLEVVLNLADYQRFLFENAEFPAIVVRFRNEKLKDEMLRIRYWSPKIDWSVSQAEIISVAPEDRKRISYRELKTELDSERSNPWKVRYWATARDEKLLDRLSSLPRLSENTSVGRRTTFPKRWIAAQGFKPEKGGKRAATSKACPWPPDQLFLSAPFDNFELFVFETDCSKLDDRYPWLYALPSANQIFEAPHVLVTHGLLAAYCEFGVVFRHALQGIHGPEGDEDLLMFLAAYLESPLARYFLFHTTSRWGVGIAEVHLEELLTVPFPFPERTADPQKATEIIAEIAAELRRAMQEAREPLVDREGIVGATQKIANRLIYEYFGISEQERTLIEDTNRVVIPSTRLSKASATVPTLRESSLPDRDAYVETLCATINDWASGGPSQVRGRVYVSHWSGIGAVELRRGEGSTIPHELLTGAQEDLLAVLNRLRKVYKTELGSIELLRSVKIFDGDRLYLFKPLRYRFWTRTAALNDADEIAASVLSQPAEAKA